MPCESQSQWVYCRESAAPATVNMPDGPITLRQGDRFETDSACEMLQFINRLPPNESTREVRDGVIRELNAAAQREGCLGGGNGVNVIPDAGASGTGTSNPPPQEGDSARDQGAPATSDGGTTSAPTHPDTGTRLPGTDPNPPPQPQPGQQHTTHSGEQSRQRTDGGDPVDLFRGAFYLDETDLVIPSTLMPLALVRRYRSGSPNFGPFGWNWDHNHNVYIRELANGNIARWNGALHEDIFELQGASFEPPRGIFERLEPVVGQPQTYTITAAGGVVWRFERPAGWADAERIPLISVTDRHGNSLRYTYNPDNQVEEVRDDDGRFLRFHYGECGLLEGLEDHAGRRIIYEHAPDYEHLACVHFPPTSDHPTGIKRAYFYERRDAMPELRHNILRVEDGDGLTFVENQYEQDVSDWSYARLIYQNFGGYEYQFRYTQLQWVPPQAVFVNIPSVRVEVLSPDYGLTTYTFNYRGDLLDHRQRLSKDGSYRVVAWTYNYDAMGNLVGETRPDGSQELKVYDHANPDPRMRGNLLRRELTAAAGFPVPSRIVWQGQYEPNFQLLREERTEDGSITRYRYDFDLAPGPGNTGKLREVIHPDATLPDGTVQVGTTRFETNARGEITAVITADGVRQENEYGVAGTGLGRLVLQRHDAGGLGIEERFEYDAVGYLSGVTDGEGEIRRMVHNALGQIERCIAPPVGGVAAEVIVHYDSSGKVNAIELPCGDYSDAVFAGTHIRHQFQRNVLGFVERFMLAANTGSQREIEQCSDHRGLPVRTVQPDGAVTCTIYDERGLLLSQETVGGDGSRAFTRRVYDRNGRIVQLIEGPAEDLVTRYRYDGFGRLVETELPNGGVIRYTWGPRDVLTSEEISGDPGDGNERVLSRKQYEYDERTRLVRATESSFRTDPTTSVDLITEFFYDAVNRLERSIDPRGGSTQYRYDNLGRLIQLIDAEGNEQHYTYDRVGRLTSIAFHDIEPTGINVRIWQMEYDSRGRLVRLIEPDGTETHEAYDDRDLPVRRTEPEGVIRERRFGAFGELLSDTLDPGGLAIVNTWTYDHRSRPKTYVDPTGEVTRYHYDGIGRPVQTELPNTTRATRMFGPDGRLATETLVSGAQFEFGYDAAGRLNFLRCPGAPGISAIADHHFEYDGLNRLVRATAGVQTVERRFDSRGRLIQEDSHGMSLKMFYDDLAGTAERHWPDGRRELIEMNLNDVGVRVTRTASGVLGSGGATLGTFVASGERHFGSSNLQGGLTVNTVYDRRKRLTQLTYQSPSGVQEQLDYRYDARGRRRVEHISSPPLQLRHYQFDARDRLLTASEGFAGAIPPADTQVDHDAAIAAIQAAAAAAARRLEFRYDASDARTLYRESGLPDRFYAYTSGHRMTSAGPENFVYSPDGTRRSDGTNTYTVDALGRVVEVLSGGATILRIEYDPLGRPGILSEGSLPPRALSYFGNDVLQESQGGATVRQITPHPMMWGSLAIHVANATLYTCFDARLNLIAAVDTAGLPVERYRYDPFGAPFIFDPAGAPRATSTVGMIPTFGGLRYLPSADLYLSLRRLMDPAHGVFLEPDPLAYLDSPSLYVFAVQDPVNLVDPEGELAFLAILGVMAVGALVAGGLNAARQGIQIAEGSRREFSWGELGLSVGIGAVAAPVLVVAPEVAIPLAAYGVAGGIDEMSQGHYATGAFDIVTSVAPFGSKRVRASTLGPGTRFGQMRGLGESASWSTRFGRFREIDAATQVAIQRATTRRFYRGTTAYEAEEAAEVGRLNLDQVLRRQHSAAASGERGPGLYFTESLEPPSPGSAWYWAKTHGANGRGGGPAVLEATIKRSDWARLSRQPGVVQGEPQSRFPPSPTNLETYIPEALSPWFNERATWRVVPDNPLPAPSFSPLWPTLFAPPFRTPDSAWASEPESRRERTGRGAETGGSGTGPATGPGSGSATGGKK